MQVSYPRMSHPRATKRTARAPRHLLLTPPLPPVISMVAVGPVDEGSVGRDGHAGGTEMPACCRAATKAAPLVGVVTKVRSQGGGAGPGGDGNPRCRSGGLPCRLHGPLRCIVGPDSVGVDPTLPSPFSLLAKPTGLLIWFGAKDLAGCRWVAWGLLARLE
jgi:hypothetical protein